MENYWSKNGIGKFLETGSYLITNFDIEFTKKLVSSVADDKIVVNTTWFSDPDYCKRLKQWTGRLSGQTLLLYSGMDWQNTNCTETTKEIHKWLSDHHPIKHIGHTSEGHYFNYWMSFIKHHNEYFFDEMYTERPNIKYHYMCLNNKCNDHRAYLLNNIMSEELDLGGLISVNQKDSRYTFDHPIQLKENRLTKLGEMFHPWEKMSPNHIVNDILTLGDPKHWSSHFATVVTETTHHTDVFISEKTFKPIIGLRPFIVIGDSGIYKKLRSWGIDVFDDIFPNATKEEDDWQKRCDNVITDLRVLTDMTVNEINMLYKSLVPRLNYNRDRVLELLVENDRWIEDLNEV